MMAHPKYPHIFEPLKVKNVVFKNRIWSAPAGAALLHCGEGYPSDSAIQYYAAKAAGGAAVITYSAQNMDVDRPYDPVHANERIDLYENQRHFQRFTDAVHFYDAKVSLELLAFAYHGYDHQGKLVNYTVNGEPDFMGNPTVKLTRNVMESIAKRYADVAEAAVKCGFDMILIHGGHGLVISQFYSPAANKRDDEFGAQTIENRMRFADMILDAIRERVGNKLLIEYRISGDDLCPDGGGYHIEDCIQMIEHLQDRIDIAHVSVGAFYNGTDHITHPTEFYDHGCNAKYAAAVKADPRIKIPVLTLGAFQDAELIEETLASGKADIVAMARGLIADGDRPVKFFEDRAEDAIPCIRCFHCLDSDHAPSFACSVNPTVGREKFLKMIAPQKSGVSKNVVVIGGGPAGMQLAITASKNGHKVTLLEKQDRLGGKLLFAEQVPFKQDLHRFMCYQIGQLKKLGVDVRLNTEATPESVAAMKPDAVIAAVGADPFILPVPGVDGPNVMTAEEAYNKVKAGETFGQKLVILGGGMVGCETGLYLAQEAGKDVTILEMLPGVANEEMFVTRPPMLKMLADNTTVITSARCTAISPEGVTYVDADGTEHTVPCDNVILSAGMRPRQDLAESFRGIAPFFTIIGDAYKAANVRNATRTGHDAAIRL